MIISFPLIQFPDQDTLRSLSEYYSNIDNIMINFEDAPSGNRSIDHGTKQIYSKVRII